jgi:hypothetical protein
VDDPDPGEDGQRAGGRRLMGRAGVRLGDSDGEDSWLSRFAQGRWCDAGGPNAWMAVIVSDVSGPGTLGSATDDQALGILRKWRSLESWSASGKLAVARELIRRRPLPGSEPGDPGGLPTEWARELEHEVSAALGISLVAARKLLRLAWSLEARLPGVGRALREDRLDLARAKMIVEETEVLADPAALARAEQMILAGLAKCRTWSDLLRLVQRAVVTVDPVAEREQGRVAFWREHSGTCGLAGTGLPADEALRANAHVEARAQAYRGAGVKRYVDLLRVMAFLDILNGVPLEARVARCRAEDAEREAQDAAGQEAQADRLARIRQAAQDKQAADDNARPGAPGEGALDSGSLEDEFPGPGGAYPPAEDPCSSCTLGNCPCCDLDPPEPPPCGDCRYGDCRCGLHPGDASGGGNHGSDPGAGDPVGTGPGGPGANGPGLPIRGNLTLPLVTLLGKAERPGEAHGLGALDPGLVRDLARAGAAHPDSEFCITITDELGHAVGHGCCKPARPRQAPGKAARRGKQGKAPPGPAPPADLDRATFTPSGKPGPPGGLGSWILTLPGAPYPFHVDIEPVPTYECDHRHESAGHNPSDKLRHLLEVRDGKCSFPTCSRRARECDFEHATPHDQGGRTCGCNCHMCSRSCHRTKQLQGWDVTEIRPGFHQWTTPAGRIYLQEPWQYPA